MGRRSGKSKKSNPDRSSDSHVRETRSSEITPVLMAQGLKEEGNRFFQTMDYESALSNYQKSLSFLPRNHTDVSCLRTNMASCYMQLGIGEYPKAIHECNLALEVTPEYVKALLKRARCYEGLNKLSLALRDVGTVLKIDHNNLMAMELEQRLKKTIEMQEEQREVGVDNEKKTEDKLVVDEERIRTVKLVFGEDIRLARIPVNCDPFKLREIVSVRFPGCEAVQVKYRDEEGDLITITTTEELRLAESSVEHGFVKLYIVETSRDMVRRDEGDKGLRIAENGKSELVCISDWILQFAQVFKNHTRLDFDAHVDSHDVGMKSYTDVIEETVTSEEVQDIFCTAGEKFREMAALALFNWGNVHFSRARKKVCFSNDLSGIESEYDWAKMEYMKARKRYEEALKIKPNLYEGVLALGQQQFEEAKLSWYYAVRTKVDLETWPSNEVLELYSNAEDNIEKGMQMWEKMRPSSSDEAVKIMSRIYLLWGNMIYERSIMEFRLGLPTWEKSQAVAVGKFELASVSSTDIALMKKNISSEGFRFNIGKFCIQSPRLDPLLQKRVSKPYHALEHV